MKGNFESHRESQAFRPVCQYGQKLIEYVYYTSEDMEVLL